MCDECGEKFKGLFSRKGMVCSECGMAVHERCVKQVEVKKRAEIERLKKVEQQQEEALQQEPPSPAPAAPKQKSPLKLTASMARFVTREDDAIADESKLQRVGDIVHFYGLGYKRPTLLEALKEAEIDEAETIVEMCMTQALRAGQEGALRETQLRAEDAAALTLWSVSFGDSEIEEGRNPFKHINNALVERAAVKLHKCRGVIFLLLFAMRGLPRVTPPVLYRGILCRVDVTKYKPGSVITWHSFSSTTTNLEVAQQFQTNKRTGKCEGTLFCIHGWGCNIKPFSCFPHEEEVLLEPEIDLKVVSISESEGLLTIELEMVPCPLLLEKLIPFAHT